MTAVVLVVLGVAVLIADGLDGSFSGVALAASAVIAAGAWLGGLFDRSTWFGDADTNERLARVDEEVGR